MRMADQIGGGVVSSCERKIMVDFTEDIIDRDDTNLATFVHNAKVESTS